MKKKQRGGGVDQGTPSPSRPLQAKLPGGNGGGSALTWAARQPKRCGAWERIEPTGLEPGEQAALESGRFDWLCETVRTPFVWRACNAKSFAAHVPRPELTLRQTPDPPKPHLVPCSRS